MKRIVMTGLALALAGSIGACVDLDEKLVSSLAPESIKTPDGLLLATNAIYSRLRGYYGREQSMAMSDMGTDIWTNGDQVSSGAQSWFYFADYSAGLGSTDDRVKNTWNNFYIMIADANAVLDNGPETPLSTTLTQAVKNSRLGEAHFLRALAYFELVRFFGPVTLNLHEAKGVTTEAHRSPEDSVYAAILADLDSAITLLPATQGEFGRATRGAAQHLQSKVYLTRAYRPWNTANKNADFTSALNLAKTVINSGTYTLSPVYTDLWCGNLPDSSANLRAKDPLRQSYCNVAAGSGFNKQNKEIIFSVQYTYTTSQYSAAWCGSGSDCANYIHLVYLSRYDNDNALAVGLARDLNNGRPFRRIRPTPYMFKLFDETRWAGTPGQSDILDTRFDGSFQSMWFASSANANGNKAAGNAIWTGVCPNCTSGAPIAVGDTALWMPGYAVSDAFRQTHKFSILVPCPQQDADPAVDCGRDNLSKRIYGWVTGPSLKKYQDNARTGGLSDQAGGKDVIIMRLGETYLIAAEADVGLGNTAEAASFINVLRTRAASPNHKADPLIMVTAGQMTLDFIMDERAREMAGEGNRWQDLTRPGADYFVNRVKRWNPDARGNVATKHALRPIPQEQINGVTGTPYPQNPGY